jgi:hypothetical protein
MFRVYLSKVNPFSTSARFSLQGLDSKARFRVVRTLVVDSAPMDNQIPPHDDDPDDPPLMTPSEFISMLSNRGLTLKTSMSDRGRTILTDGRKPYVLPLLRKGMMPASLVLDVLYHFLRQENADLLRTDFHLDPKPDD